MNVVTACGRFLVWSLCFLSPALAISSQDQNAGQQAIGQEAVSVVLKHYALNPLAIDPATGKALSATGQWSIGKTPPQVCSQKKDFPCVEVIYQIPAETVHCTWVVLLDQDGKDGAFLDESEDSARYLLRRVVGGESSSMVISRRKPAYPPIAQAAHVSGAVTVSVIVSPTGETDQSTVMSGPELLRSAAIEAARAWTFKPLLVGTRGVPYQINLVFTFRTMGPSTGSVTMNP